jgi:hypothetical protein
MVSNDRERWAARADITLSDFAVSSSDTVHLAALALFSGSGSGLRRTS